IWGDRIFLTTAVDLSGGKSRLKVGLYGDVRPVTDDGKQEWRVLCLDKKTGRILWQKTANSGTPIIKRHPKATHANSTAATNGAYVVAFFGSEGLYCYNLEGKLIWKKDLGTLDSGFFIAPDAQWGFASSPVIHEDMVIVQCDVQKDSFVAAFSITDGSQLWRTERDEVPGWSTPTVHGSQVILNGFRHIGGYDARTGKSIWRFAGGGDIPTPTPVVAHDHVYITNSHGGKSPIYAVRLDASGDLTPDNGITWSH
ncbi:MAG: PQQ-binding-like beta-propeller repeat protein, partial [bacterium]|nr:PQQ-binding-like beta-propeller repeat protein [bacterium]